MTRPSSRPFRKPSSVSRLLVAAALLFAAVLGLRAAQSQMAKTQITVLDGFTVQEVYSADKSGSVVALTFDSRGRLVFSREKGPVVRLIDRDGDGRGDEEQVITEHVVNCQGLEFDGDDLLAVGLGPDGTGLYRVSDTNGDGASDRITLLTAATDDIGEHGPHAVFFGPDGFLYWILGNHTTIAPSFEPLSPLRGYVDGQLLPYYVDPRGHATDYRSPGGIIVRTNLAAQPSTAPAQPSAAGAQALPLRWELVGGGLRNAYDAAFNLTGELFTFDSDMEWDIGLPWYRPVRTHHVPPGADFGWRTGSAVWPDYFVDSLGAMSNIGRGSPVGVAFYQGNRFPPAYQDAFILGDWSRGRILISTLERSGASYRAQVKDFVLGTPLNVTDLDVGPDGAVYFAKGGRGTEGGIFRVVYTGKPEVPMAKWANWLEAALNQPQPRSAWGRAKLAALRKTHDADWATSLRAAVSDTHRDAAQRARALELLQVYGPAPEEAWLAGFAQDTSWDVRAASTYYLGLQATDSARVELVRRLKDADPFIRRRAAEALIRTGIHPEIATPIAPATDLLPLLGDADRHVRWAARQALVRTNRNLWREAAFAIDRHPAATEALLALTETAVGTFEIRALLERELTLLQANPTNEPLLPLLRVVHRTLTADQGVVYPKVEGAMGEWALAKFPTGQASLDRELARTLARLGTPGAIPKIVAALTASSTDREQQIHYAYCLRAMKSGWAPADRQALVGWFKKTQDERWKGGSSFAGYLDAMWTDVLAQLPEQERAAAMTAVPTLGPQSGANAAPQWQINETANFSEQELREYLEFDPMAYAGSPQQGKAAFTKAFCVNCHRHGDIGQEAGPDLTDVARRFKRKDVLDAILYPSRTISDQWAAVEIITKQKVSALGVVTSETADAVTMRTVAGGRVTIPTRDIVSRKTATTSPMPEGLLNGLSLQEVRDLFAFLEQGGAGQP
jgi:putative heme-binding domain-containing protein